MPGLLLCFVMRYDNYKKHALAATDTEQSKITYFHCSLIGYIVGKNLWITSHFTLFQFFSGRTFYIRVKRVIPAILSNTL